MQYSPFALRIGHWLNTSIAPPLTSWSQTTNIQIYDKLIGAKHIYLTITYLIMLTKQQPSIHLCDVFLNFVLSNFTYKVFMLFIDRIPQLVSIKFVKLLDIALNICGLILFLQQSPTKNMNKNTC